MSAVDARAIDVHAHVVLDDVLGAAGEFGPEIGADASGQPWFRVCSYRLDGVRYRNSAFMDTELRLAGMDRAKIDFQLLSPNPLTYFHHIESARAIEFCQRHNDALVRQLAEHPQRLGGFAALPMQEPTAAAEELERAVSELGLVGGYVGTEFGIPLDAKELDPFYAKVAALDVPRPICPFRSGRLAPCSTSTVGWGSACR